MDSAKDLKPILFISLENQTIPALLDTGSTLNLVSWETWLALGKNYKQSPSNLKLSGAGGSEIVVTGTISRVPIVSISSENEKCEMLVDAHVVKNLKVPVILGMQFLRKGGSIVDIGRLKLHMGGHEFNLVNFTASPDTTQIKVQSVNDVTIQPSEIREVSTTVSYSGNIPKAASYYIEAPEEGWMTVGSEVANLVEGKAILRVQNSSSAEQTLTKGTQFELSPIIELFTISTSKAEEQPPDPALWQDDRVAQILAKVKIGFNGMPQHVETQIKETIRTYADIFLLDGEGRQGPDLIIKLEPIHRIPVIDRPTKIGFHQLEAVEKELQRLLKEGVIRPSNSPYCSKMFLLRKPSKQGEQPAYRLISDFRGINKLLPSKPTQLEDCDVVFSRLGGKKFFGSFDLKSSYHQLALSEDSKAMTAFSANKIKYEYNVLALGLKTSSHYLVTIVRAMMSTIPVNEATAWMDDVLTYCESIDKFLETFIELCSRLRKFKLYLAPNKCFILRTEIRFLGYVISEGRIAVDPERIGSLLQTKVPTTIKQVRSIIGAGSFLRTHIPKFENRCKGLRSDLKAATRKKGAIKLSEEGIASFYSLLEGIAESIDLTFIRQDADLYLYTDASSYALGGCLLHYDKDQNPKPIGFFSKIIPKPIRVNHISTLEMYAIVCSVKKFDFFLRDKHFTILSDSKTVCSPSYLKLLTRPIHLRWLETLANYSFQLVHISSASNLISDWLSRKDIGLLPETEFEEDTGSESEDISPKQLLKQIPKGIKVKQETSLIGHIEGAVPERQRAQVISNSHVPEAIPENTAARVITDQTIPKGIRVKQETSLVGHTHEEEVPERPRVQVISTSHVPEAIPENSARVSTGQTEESLTRSTVGLRINDEESIFSKVQFTVNLISEPAKKKDDSPDYSNKQEPLLDLTLTPAEQLDPTRHVNIQPETVKGVKPGEDSGLLIEQLKDPLTRYLIDHLKQGTEPKPASPSHDLEEYLALWTKLFLDEEGCLLARIYLKWSCNETVVICLPQALISPTIQFAHSGGGAGHLNTDKLYARLRERYFCPDLFQACQYHVYSCLVCEKVAAKGQKCSPIQGSSCNLHCHQRAQATICWSLSQSNDRAHSQCSLLATSTRQKECRWPAQNIC